MDHKEKNVSGDINISGLILRVVLTALIVGITAFLTPGFTVDGVGSLLIAGVIIAGLDYLIERIAGLDASSFGRGVTGFVVAAGILYATQFFISGFNITILGAIIGALVIGVIDMIIPGRVM